MHFSLWGNVSQRDSFLSAPYYLISWPEECSFSVVPGKNISPSADQLAPGCTCKIKGFEKCLAQVLASGMRSEMEKKLADEEECSAPPPKRAKTDKNT